MVQWSAKNVFESPVKAMFLGGVVDILLGGMHDADDIYPFGKYWQILANIGKYWQIITIPLRLNVPPKPNPGFVLAGRDS